MRWLLILLVCLASPLAAKDWDVPNRPGAIGAFLNRAADGDTLRLSPGVYFETLTLSRPVTIDGGGLATIDAKGQGSVITITGADVTVTGLTIIGSGSRHEDIDSGVKVTKTAQDAQVSDNVLLGNLYGVDVHGGRDALVGAQRHRGSQRQPDERARQRRLRLERAGYDCRGQRHPLGTRRHFCQHVQTQHFPRQPVS